MNDLINPPHIYKYVTIINPALESKENNINLNIHNSKIIINHYSNFSNEVLSNNYGFRFAYFSYPLNAHEISIDNNGNIFKKENNQLIKIATYKTHEIKG